jgi:hypothetical protein
MGNYTRSFIAGFIAGLRDMARFGFWALVAAGMLYAVVHRLP